MENIKENQPNQFDGFAGMMVIYKNKWFIIIFTILATLGSVIYVLNAQVWYASTINVVPPSRQETSLSGAMTGISSALKDFGLTRLAGGASDGYTFMVILQSRTVVDSIIEKYDLYPTYKIKDRVKVKARKAFLENVAINYERDGNYTVTVWDIDPERSAAMANDYIQLANDLAIKIYRQETTHNRKHLENRIAQTDSTIKAIGDSLNKYSKRYMLFSPEDQAKAISSSFAELKSLQIQSEIKYETNKSIFGENDPMTIKYKQILDDTKNKISQAEKDKGFAGNFAIGDATAVAIEYMRLYTEFETFSKVKAFLLPMLEEARLDESKKINNLYVVDPANVPEMKDRPRRSLIVGGAFLGAFVTAVLIVFLANGYRRFLIKYRKTMLELKNAANK